jgi:hypothetical protein
MEQDQGQRDLREVEDRTGVQSLVEREADDDARDDEGHRCGDIPPLGPPAHQRPACHQQRQGCQDHAPRGLHVGQYPSVRSRAGFG